MFKSMYKQSIDLGFLQSQRRQKILDEIKAKRVLAHDNIRRMEDKLKHCAGLKAGDSSSQPAARNVMEPSTSSGNRPFFKRPNKTFREKYKIEDISLQLSEWLYGPPDDLSDWLLVPCPAGQRVMVVANGGWTEVYSKDGNFICSFKSLLPNGGARHIKHGISILDCIYTRQTQEFFILDIIAFKDNLSHLQFTPELRFFMIRSLFEKIPALQEYAANNKKPFHPLDVYDLKDLDKALEILQKYPYWPENKPRVDGFLFYHRESHYTCGQTPLVGWLFPYMLPDILKFRVNSAYLEDAPENWHTADTPTDFMNEFDERLALKKKQREERGNGRTHFSRSRVGQQELSEKMEIAETQESDEENTVDSNIKVFMEQESLELGLKD